LDFGDELRAFAEILDEEVIATVIAMSRRRELVMMSIDVDRCVEEVWSVEAGGWSVCMAWDADRRQKRVIVISRW